MSPSSDRLDYAIVIALKEEISELASMLDVGVESDSVATETAYRFRFLDHIGQNRRAVAVLIDDMGNTESAAVTSNVIAQFHPKVIVNIGLSGALSSDVKLGDVVVAADVDEYFYRGKAIPAKDPNSGFRVRFGGKTRECSQATARTLSSLEVMRPSAFHKWAVAAREKSRSLLGEVAADELTSRGLLNVSPRIHSGPTASGPLVGAASDFVEVLKDHNRNFLSLDMESAGVLSAASRQPDIVRVVIRVISDFSDQRKSTFDEKYKGQIRALAVHNGTTLLKYCLSQAVIEAQSPSSIRVPSLAVTTGQKSLEILVATLHDLAIHQFKPPYANHAFNDAHLADLGQMYRSIVSCPKSPAITKQGDLFGSLCRIVLTTNHRYPLQLQGAAGTGKTVFLYAIYAALRKAYEQDPHSPVPVFIDLRAYVELTHDPTQAKPAVIRLNNDLECLRELCERF